MRVDASSKSDSYQFAPNERPAFVGSPFSPQHSAWRRAIFGCVGLLTGLCSAFPNALGTVNVGSISGSLGLYVAQASWLPAIYVAMNASANLTLVKARTQFGVPTVTQTLLIAYAAVDLLQFMFPGLASAVIIRAISGVTAACLVTLAVYFFVQDFSVKFRPLAL